VGKSDLVYDVRGRLIEEQHRLEVEHVRKVHPRKFLLHHTLTTLIILPKPWTSTHISANIYYCRI